MAVEAARKDWRVVTNALSHLCGVIHELSLATRLRHFVEIVMIEKLYCILSKRATKPVYIRKYKYG